MCHERWALHVAIKRKFFLHLLLITLKSKPAERLYLISAHCSLNHAVIQRNDVSVPYRVTSGMARVAITCKQISEVVTILNHQQQLSSQYYLRQLEKRRQLKTSISEYNNFYRAAWNADAV